MAVAEARARIAELAHLNAFITVSWEDGQGPLVAVKDLVDVAGLPTTAGGIILPREPATTDATVVTRLRRAGCVIVGKTNLHEWALGITSVNPHYGPVRNPHDPDRAAGGSSGGSAVAVATGMCDWAVGTDTGGSIRIPAALTGVVGIKPTHGAIPMDGVFPLSPTQDTLGPLAMDVTAAARALETMTERDDLVPSGPVRQPRLAVPTGWVEDLDQPTATVWAEVAEDLPEVLLPSRQVLVDCGVTILLYEAAAVHRHWLESRPEDYGADVLALLRQGAEIPPAEYEQALHRRERLTRLMEVGLRQVDAVILPTTAAVAPPIQDQLRLRDIYTRFTRPFNVTGQPAISIPFPTVGLPVGIQLASARGNEQTLLRAASTLERRWRYA